MGALKQSVRASEERNKRLRPVGTKGIQLRNQSNSNANYSVSTQPRPMRWDPCLTLLKWLKPDNRQVMDLLMTSLCLWIRVLFWPHQRSFFLQPMGISTETHNWIVCKAEGFGNTQP